MNKAIALCFLFASLALAQKQSIVVLPSLDLDSKLTPKQKDILMEEVRTIATKLPQTDFFLMKQDEVNERLGDEAVATACEEGTCVGNLIKQLQATFGARCEVSADGNQLYLRFELYGTLKGDNVPRTVDQFNEPVKNFPEMLALIKKKVPDVFNKITKSPQENCENGGNIWENGACITVTQMAKEACENEGKKWHGGECKSQAQIICEATKGRVWHGEECKTAEQIACENRGNGMMWINGACKAPPAPGTAPTASTHRVHFTSTPSGASLTLEDDQNSYKCETPCNATLRRGRVKVSAGSDAYYERKDTAIYVTGDNQQVNLKLNPNYGTLNITGANGWDLSIGDKRIPYLDDIRLLPGAYNAKLTHNDYEDVSFNVDIMKNERKVFDISDRIVHKYGILDINPAFIDGIGKNEGWTLTADGQYYSLGEVRLLHGDYQLRLTHNCYEDITAEAKIGRNEKTYFDISDKLVPKQGTLVLRSKRKGRNQSKPVFINGKQSGETPFEGSMPLCSEIKIGSETVNVKLEQNKPVEYVHRESTWGSHLLGVTLDLAGAGLLGYSFYSFSQRDKAYDRYSEEKPFGNEYLSEYDSQWDKVKKEHSKGNIFLIAGSAILAVGVGVHIWF